MQKLFTLVLVVLFSVMVPLTAAATNCSPQITITKPGSADIVKKSTPVIKVINKTNAPAEYQKLIVYYGKTTSKYYTPVNNTPTDKTPVAKKPVVKIPVVKKPPVVVSPPVVVKPPVVVTPPAAEPPVVTPPVVEPPVTQPVTPPVVEPPVVETPNSEFNAMQLEMLSYINAARSEAGRPALTLDKTLCEGAYLKSKDMAVNSYFSHTSPTYGSPFDMMKSLGITYRAAGENIAKNISVKDAHDAFMNSSDHRANILSSNFSKVGLGFYQQGNYLYVTQWFTN